MRKVFCGVVISAMLMSTVAFGAGDPAKGKESYDMLCGSCHGAVGKGDGAAAAALNPKPRDFSSKDAMTKLEDAYLKDVITKGGAALGKSAAMPPWGAMLKPAQVENVVAYIRTLAK